MEPRSTQLSPQAFADLKVITLKELGPDMTDGQIEEMGVNLLRLFDVLVTSPAESTPQLKLSPEESKALEYIKGEIEQHRSPSVRDLSKAMGFRSSRSGFRLLKRLIERGVVCRDCDGVLQLSKSNHGDTEAASSWTVGCFRYTHMAD